MANQENVGGLRADAEIETGKFDAAINKMASVVEKTNPSMKKMEQTLNRVESASKGAGSGADLASVSLQKMTAAFGGANLASRLLYDAILKIKQGAQFALTAPLQNARSFETAMARVGTITRGSAQEIDTLGKQVLGLTKVIPKTKEDLGAGLYQILQSGVGKASDAMKVLEVSAKAAVGGVTEVDTAASVLTNTMNAYGFSAAEAAHIADVMFVGAREGTAEFAELATSMGTVNATASLLGVSVNEVVAGLETLSLAGISAEESGTALNRLLLSIINPSQEVSEAVREIQKQFKDFEFSAEALKKKGLQQFMKELAEVVGGNTRLMVTLAGDVRAFKAAAVIAGEGAENFARILKATQTESGALDEAFLRNADTLDSLLTVAWNTFIATITEAGQEHLPEIKEAIRDLLDTLNDNKDSIIATALAFSQNLVSALQLVVEHAPAVIDALGKIASVASKAASAISGTLDFMSKTGETIGASVVGLWDQDTSKAVLDAHAQGKTYRQTLSEDERRLEEAADLTRQSEESLARARRRGQQIEQIESGALPVADKDFVLQEMRKGKTLEDVQAELISKQDLRSRRQGVGGGVDSAVGGGGGGGSAKDSLAQSKKILSEIEKLERDIEQTRKEQVRQNKDRVDRLRDELKLKDRLGVITKDEEKTLATINRRVEYGEDRIREMTDEWEKQQRAVEDLREEIKGINEDLIKSGKELDKNLAKIDEDLSKRKAEIEQETGRKKVEKIADLLRERQELEGKIEATSGDEQTLAIRRRGEIDHILAPLKGTTEGEQLLAEGQRLSGLSDLGSIDEAQRQANADAEAEAQRQRMELVKQANEELEEQLSRLAGAQLALHEAEIARDGTEKALIATMNELSTTTSRTYTAIETATTLHVNKQITEIQRLTAHLDSLSSKYQSVGSFLGGSSETEAVSPTLSRAGGGPIFGPGTSTSDSILARLSNGEHVLTAAEVRAMGGHSAVLDFRHLLHDLPKFAQGGPVTNTTDQSRVANVTIHNHGELADAMSKPHMVGWYARQALR